ncbi:SusC/RagA family TonB-linked outer membrane protein [Flavobacterium quisquiliarum]|uniref:SusC/RagA family TonB-linked outer membrane protein n=1 Tax=Flavobacterium quisquiliarum TaxID=1834436 RepID=A0ABV8W8V6_9FLAO|nr:TonB-dependent receptor [Flavobacterium quisquiliarum]MBW1654111.1 SusC/RagA family TonB-linked outer membrane protein [Flavobacterium quisquiliarum]NWL03403.1 TonB-dependent receptor [Flavobacterium collinsii]
MKKMMFFLLFCLASVAIQAQSRQLKGSVIDPDGMPLIGANIAVEGSKEGVSTDFDGNFQINVPAGKNAIKVSYMGHKDMTVDITGKNTVKVQMETVSNQMQEVVVVGYGTQKKETVTGALGIVKGAELNKRAVASLSTALQGQIAGVTVQQTSGEPGSDGANIRIRGIGSVNSNTFPLVLVDGIEMDMNQVDMNTVESVSVLKDAASASIYGSRASNGVILITTKRGKEGKMRLAFDSYTTIQTPVNMPKVVKAADYLQSELNAADNAGLQQAPGVREAKEQMIADQRAYKPDNWNRYDTDWKDATIKNSALMNSNNVTLSGGSKDLKYFGALTSLHQGGLIANNNFKRMNVRLNTDANINSWLKLNNEFSYRTSTQVTPGISSPKAIINKALYMLPTLSAVKELDGNWGYGKNGDNPVANAEASGQNTMIRPEILLNATLIATPVKDLEILGQYSYRKTDARATYIMTPYATSLKGLFQGYYPSKDATVSESYTENVRNYFRAQASYSKKFGEHETKLMVGTQSENNQARDFSAARNSFELERYYLSNGTGTPTVYGGATEWSMSSFYGRFNYNYAGKYLFETSGRYDGSSRFSDGLKWGFFPSFSAGWVVSKEKFMEPILDYVSDFKLRASVGTLGNQDIGNYPYASTIDTGYSYWIDKQLAPGVAQTTLSNPNITWEKSRQTNFGLDATFFKRKLSATLDYYIKDVYDMLMVYPVPYYVGLNATYSNAGDMRNKGWETSLSYKNKIGEFNYSITAALSNNENEITRLYGQYSDRSITLGYPRGGIWGYKTDGYYVDAADVANSPKLSSSAKPGYVKYVKMDQSGSNPNQITESDKVYLGDPFPHYEYSLNLTANYKNFDLTCFFQGVGERKVLMSGIGVKPFANGSNLFVHQLDSWTPDHQDAAYPILVPEANSADNFVTSDKWVKNGAYLRLKNVVLGYSLPKSFLEKAHIDGLRLYVSGQNLWTLSHFVSGYDPEVNYGGSLGGEFYPIMQTITFGANLKF